MSVSSGMGSSDIAVVIQKSFASDEFFRDLTDHSGTFNTAVVGIDQPVHGIHIRNPDEARLVFIFRKKWMEAVVDGRA
jgi:hypothetical protein